jgi:hypothetical protein
MAKLAEAINTMLNEFSRLCESGDDAIAALRNEAKKRSISLETLIWLSIHFASCSFDDDEGLQIYLDAACEKIMSNDPNT